MEVLLSGLLVINVHFTWQLLERLSSFNYRIKRLEDEVFLEEKGFQDEAFS